MTASFKPSEGKSQSRSYSRKLKKEAYQLQIDKLPNEFRDTFNDYNFKAVGGIGHIDENDYYIQ